MHTSKLHALDIQQCFFTHARRITIARYDFEIIMIKAIPYHNSVILLTIKEKTRKQKANRMLTLGMECRHRYSQLFANQWQDVGNAEYTTSHTTNSNY